MLEEETLAKAAATPSAVIASAVETVPVPSTFSTVAPLVWAKQ